MKRRQTREERQAERDKRNALLRAYGYHWKRTEQLTTEQWHVAIDNLGHPEDSLPDWTLLSPLEMPVRDTTILRWLGERGASGDDVLAFIAKHGFVSEGKDERGIWQIQTPSARETINLKQALQEVERIRIDQAEARRRAREQEMKERFERSAQSLKEMLDLHGYAVNAEPAWGYSPYPSAKRLPDGTIEVTTYHFESEWRTEICQSEAEVVISLYAGEEEGYWDPGIWVESVGES